uniref:Uncharacterized protein n=1 Tax=viral metagenome TaxID=1070528 RepID=A0A6M3JK77_9ZZZZ
MKCKICGKYFNGGSEQPGTCTECYYEFHESKEELLRDYPNQLEDEEGEDEDEDQGD